MNRAQALGSVIAVFALTLAACSSAQQDGDSRYYIYFELCVGG